MHCQMLEGSGIDSAPTASSQQARGIFNLLKCVRFGILCVGTGKQQTSSAESEMEIWSPLVKSPPARVTNS